MRDVIEKSLDDPVKAGESPFQITKEGWEAQIQSDKDLKERGIGIFSFDGGEPGENVAAKIVEFIEKETGIKIEIACVKYGF